MLRVAAERFRIGRLGFLLVGLIATLVHYNAHRFLTLPSSRWSQTVLPTLIYDSLFHWIPGAVEDTSGVFGSPVHAYSLPVFAIGVLVTLARLRDIGIAIPWGLLLLIPGVRLMVLLILGILPSSTAKEESAAEPGSEPAQRFALLPRSRWGCALTVVLISACVGVLFTAISTEVFGDYGWALFAATPFLLGLLSTTLYGWQHGLRRWDAVSLSIMTVIFSGILLFGLAVEGIICLVMAAPIASALAILGGLTAEAVLIATGCTRNPRLMCIAVFSIPLLLVTEQNGSESAPEFTVSSSVLIAAPAERIWPLIVDVDELPRAQSLWTKVNIATFHRAWTSGVGKGATRVCEFHTGVAQETVEVWDPPHRLDLRVDSTPVPMEEWTPYRHLHPRHLDGYYQVNHASFELTPVPNGTLLRGTTRFQHGLWPAEYWGWWCTPVVRNLQLRVLSETKLRAEALSKP
jgi:uncharacterized membrane protein YhaH (DUF805 family)